MRLLDAIKSIAPPVRVRIIKHLSSDLRNPWQVGLAAHKRRRARECRRICTTYMPELPSMLKHQAD